MMGNDENCGDPDGLAYDLEVARGLHSEQIRMREAAERIWMAIANGEADSTTMVCWVEHVARKICSGLVKNDDLDDRQRGSAALMATGLYGKDDRFREMRSLIAMWLDFGELAQIKNGPKWQLTPMMIAIAVRSRALI